MADRRSRRGSSHSSADRDGSAALELAALAQYEKLNATENALKRLRVQMTLRIKAALTPEQQAQVHALKSAPASNSAGTPAARDSVAGKLQRVKQGLERWKREGREVARVCELWDQFQQEAEKRRHAEAHRALNEALTILEIAPAATPAAR